MIKKYLKKFFTKEFEEKEKEIKRLRSLIKSFDSNSYQDDLFAALLQDMGFPFIDFWNIDSDGRPKHPASDLSTKEREKYLSAIYSIYTDPKFIQIFEYTLNTIANHSMQKASEENIKNGRYAIIGLRTLFNEFKLLSDEYLALQDEDIDFDKFEVLPS